MQKKIIVKISSELLDIVPKFIENRKADTEVLKTALKVSDFKSLANIGHKLSGSSGGYGFDVLGDIAARIETSAKQQDSVKLALLISEYESYVNNLEVIFSNEPL